MKQIGLLLLLAMTLTSFQFRSKRKILLIAADKNVASLLEQQKILRADSQGIEERDLVIETHLSDNHNKDLFTKYNAQSTPFLFILIGKDGGEKLRSPQVVTTRQLFGLIDQMPMRRGEMERRKKN